MSFNKRYFTWESIIDHKKVYNFDTFDKWVLNSDCFICNDSLSSSFISCYSLEEKPVRKILYSSLDEKKTFIRELVSCIKKTRKISKKNSDDPSIDKIISSLREKWNTLPEKYFKI